MSLARRYRPQLFRDVFGQEPAVQTLKNALKEQKSAHAYLFCGTRGCGKTTLARILAKALNCAHFHEKQEPCLECDCCRQISTGNSLDIIEIDGASHRGIDDVRQLQETVNFQPSMGRYKIYIIDEVHMLTKEAFNALLKTLEEPPTTVKFFFATTEPHKLPATILSRCQRLQLKRISPQKIQEAICAILQKECIDFEIEAVSELSQRAQGSMRDGLSLLDQLLAYESGKLTFSGLQSMLGSAPHDIFEGLELAIQHKNPSKALELCQLLLSQGLECGPFIEQLQAHYRHLLSVKCGRTLQEMGPHQLPHYHEWASKYSADNLIYILEFLAESLERTKQSLNQKLHLEMTLLHLIRRPWEHSFDAILQRLSELESQLVSATKHTSTPTSLQSSYSQVKAGLAKSAELTEQALMPPVAPKLQVASPIMPNSNTQALAKPDVSVQPPVQSETKITSQPSIPLPPGRYEGLVQFAARELGGHLRY